jgi:sialate O-acetylesterase
MSKAVLGLIFPVCVLAMSASADAEIHVASVFGNGMVLQRELPVPVWGTAEPEEKVTLSFAGQHLSTTANDEGKWMVKLSPL